MVENSHALSHARLFSAAAAEKEQKESNEIQQELWASLVTSPFSFPLSASG